MNLNQLNRVIADKEGGAINQNISQIGETRKIIFDLALKEGVDLKKIFSKVPCPVRFL